MASQASGATFATPDEAKKGSKIDPFLKPRSKKWGQKSYFWKKCIFFRKIEIFSTRRSLDPGSFHGVWIMSFLLDGRGLLPFESLLRTSRSDAETSFRSQKWENSDDGAFGGPHRFSLQRKGRISSIFWADAVQIEESRWPKIAKIMIFRFPRFDDHGVRFFSPQFYTCGGLLGSEAYYRNSYRGYTISSSQWWINAWLEIILLAQALSIMNQHSISLLIGRRTAAESFQKASLHGNLC